MKQLLLSGLLLSLIACQSSTDVSPLSASDAVVGTYQTNPFLDYTRLTLSTGQMPVVSIRPAADNTLTLTITQAVPTATVRAITGVVAVWHDDQRTNLIYKGQVIGSVQTGRAFTVNGMETQGKLLRLADSTLTFIGYRP